MKNKSLDVHNITKIAMLFAVTIVLTFLENLIPPITTLPPGVKLGLSNIVIMFTVFCVGKKEAVLLLILKTLFVFLTRGATAFFMSLSGGFLSILVMFLLILLKKNKLSYIIISVFAAIAHNMGQLVVACIILESTTALYYSPVLIISGVVMGIITGTILKVIMPALEKLNINKK